MYLKIIFVLVATIVISACSTKQLVKIDSNIGIPLEKIDHWKLNARVAIRLPNESHTATLNWKKNNDTFDFYLTGAFGVTIAHIIQEKNTASLEVSKSDKLYHDDIETLLYQSLGWSFPIKQLSSWVKGLPSGDPKEVITRDSFGRIKQITFELWEVDFSKYKKYSGFILPKMINAQHPSLSLKVVAKDWDFYE